MSTPERPASSYYCRQCGTTSTDAGRCSQCHSESLEEIPVTTTTTENDEDFEQIFNSNLDLQAFTNLLLPMLMSQTPTLRPPAARHRRARHPRRIKRAVQTHRHTPHLDLMSLPTSQIQFFPLDDFLPRPVFQPNVTLVQMPFQLLVFDSQRENVNSRTVCSAIQWRYGRRATKQNRDQPINSYQQWVPWSFLSRTLHHSAMS